MHPKLYNTDIKLRIMKKSLFLLLTVTMMLTFGSCKKTPMYLYVDTEASEPRVGMIEAEEDDAAYYKSFEKYSETRHYSNFSAVEKSRAYIGDGLDACESDVPEQGMAVPADDALGDVITTDDSETMGEYPMYFDLSKDLPPNFILYKITDKDARQAAQDLMDKNISFEEFQKKIKDKSEILYDPEQHKNLYEQEFAKCCDIDKRVYTNMLNKFKERAKKPQNSAVPPVE